MDIERNRLLLSAIDNSEEIVDLSGVKLGMVLPVSVNSSSKAGVIVRVCGNIFGRISLVDLSDDYSQADPLSFTKGQGLRACVVDVDLEQKRILLSSRPSLVSEQKNTVVDKRIAHIDDVKVNDVIRGFVHKVTDQGIYINIAPTISAFAKISNLSDKYIKDWKSVFQAHQLVKGRVIQVNPAKKIVNMSLKESHLQEGYTPKITYDDVEVGKIFTARVRTVADYGVFVVVENSENVSGLCHRTQVADDRIQDITKLFDEGDRVKVKVLKFQKNQRKLAFGMKASYFEDAASDSEIDGLSEEDIENGMELDSDMDEDEVDDEVVHADTTLDVDTDNDLDDPAAADLDGDVPSSNEDGDELAVGGFNWNSGIGAEVDQLGDSDSEAEVAQKQKKKRKPEIQVDRTGDLDKHGRQSVDDFEKHLLSQPNSSALWIEYMVFQMKLSELDKAREVAERALNTINIREEDEKMNVWIALLNLENTYGSSASLDDVFSRACMYNDKAEMYERLATIFIASARHDVSCHLGVLWKSLTNESIRKQKSCSRK